MSEWQPLETAPRDGTLIDVWESGENGASRTCDVRFADGRWHTPEGEYTTERNPTHWMPSPQPPEEDSKEKS